MSAFKCFIQLFQCSFVFLLAIFKYYSLAFCLLKEPKIGHKFMFGILSSCHKPYCVTVTIRFWFGFELKLWNIAFLTFGEACRVYMGSICYDWGISVFELCYWHNIYRIFSSCFSYISPVLLIHYEHIVKYTLLNWVRNPETNKNFSIS